MDRQKLFAEILDNRQITVLFQPIVDLRTAEVIGYEALSRGPEQTELYTPLALIRTAQELGRICELEMLFKTVALERASQLGIDRLLFLNIEPSAVNDNAFTSCLNVKFFEKHGVSADAIVIELTERLVTANPETLRANVQSFKGSGINVAFDGAGGFSNFYTLSKVDPKYLKIDASLIRDINRDVVRQSVVRAFVTLASLTNTRLIAEGVETSEELRFLLTLGVYAGQGYYLAKPEKELVGISSEAKGVISRFLRRYGEHGRSRVHCIGNICEKVPAFEASETCIAIKKEMDRNQFEGLCLLCKDTIVGLVMKRQLDAVLSSQYGHSLFANKPVSRIMDTHCMVVDYNTPVKDVADLVLTRPQERIYDNIVVTKNNAYAGMVTVVELLKYAMEIQYSTALERNPLTQLPGNNLINARLSELIADGGSACLLYFDLNHFKEYNDVYGFGKGDMLLMLARNVICSVASAKRHDIFVGHIGGDDFVVEAHCDIEESRQLCEEIIRRFDSSVPTYYSAEDRAKGYITTEGRSHKLKTYPLTQIAVAGLCGHFGRFKTTEELAGYISKLKKIAKSCATSAYVIEDLTCGQMISSAALSG